MTSKSLTLRLALLAATGCAAALLLAGILFTSLFRQAMEDTIDDRLQDHMFNIIGEAITETGIDQDAADEIEEPRFRTTLSGWYWQIRAVSTGEVVAESKSLFGEILEETPFPPANGEIVARYMIGPNDVRLRTIERLVTDPRTGDEQQASEASSAIGDKNSVEQSAQHDQRDTTYAVLVAGNADKLAAEIAEFVWTVTVTLAIFAFLLVAGAALLIRFGLRPLRDVRAALRRVRLGESASMEGDYPLEIEPLVSDMNALITSNREIVERSRTHVGNLAHALKTPIAVLQNEAAGEDQLSRQVRDQVATMQHQITHHLDRAQMAAQSKVLGVVTPVAPIIDGLERVMRKVHQEKNLTINVHRQADLRFRGERQDLEEMIGNLLDNACKWADSEIRLSATAETRGRDDRLIVIIDDDGPGLSGQEYEEALSRGRRMDQSVPGSGLGLSIVDELARVYGGEFQLQPAKLGGLSAQLDLPLAFDR